MTHTQELIGNGWATFWTIFCFSLFIASAICGWFFEKKDFKS